MRTPGQYWSSTLEAAQAASRQRLEALFRLLLARAFAGKLVPQDPKDEPAAALLERIRIERNNANDPRRPKQA